MCNLHSTRRALQLSRLSGFRLTVFCVSFYVERALHYRLHWKYIESRYLYIYFSPQLYFRRHLFKEACRWFGSRLAPLTPCVTLHLITGSGVWLVQISRSSVQCGNLWLYGFHRMHNCTAETDLYVVHIFIWFFYLRSIDIWQNNKSICNMLLYKALWRSLANPALPLQKINI